MKQLSILLLVLMLGLTLTACGSAKTTVASTPPAAVEQSSPPQASKQADSQDMARSDGQGAITIEVKPNNLNDSGDVLFFAVSMTTHSIDLSMDLATLATLTTDDRRTVKATLWDAPRGGHHVSGTLSFPASVDGKALLDGTTTLTMTIKDVDAPERVFSWDLQK
jgi:hypothetical protein